MILDTFVSIFEADTEELKKGYDQAQKSTDQMSDSLKKVEDQSIKTTESIGSLAKKAAGFFLAYAAANASFNSVVNEAADIRALDNLSSSLNDSIEDVDALVKSMQNIGVSRSDTDNALKSIYGNMQKLGINASSATDAMSKLSDQVSRMDDKKAKEYLRSVGITDPRMVEAIRKGGNTIQDMMKAQKELGVTTKESAEKALAFDTAMTRLGAGTDSIRSKIANAMMPAFTYFLNLLIKFVGFLNNNGTLVTSFFIGLASILALSYTPALLATAKATWALLAPYIPLIAAIGVAAFAIDDITHYLQGHDSVLGRTINTLRELSPEYAKASDAFSTWIADFADSDDKIGMVKNLFKDIGWFALGASQEVGKSVNGVFESWEIEISDFVESQIDKLKNLVQRAIDEINNLWAGVKDFAKVDTVNTAILDAFGAGGKYNEEVYDLNELRRKAGWIEGEDGVLYDPKRINENISHASNNLQSVDQNPLNSLTSDSIKANNISNETRVTVGDITINTQATSADDISRAFRSELEEQLQSLSQEYNTGIIK